MGGQLTEEFECKAGLRQGCKMSPTIFSLLINEVAEALDREGCSGYQLIRGSKAIKSLMFADDIAIIADTPARLQKAINGLQRVSKRLGLQVNLGKTKVMVFRAGGFLAEREKWYYNGERVEVVNSY